VTGSMLSSPPYSMRSCSYCSLVGSRLTFFCLFIVRTLLLLSFSSSSSDGGCGSSGLIVVVNAGKSNHDIVNPTFFHKDLGYYQIIMHGSKYFLLQNDSASPFPDRYTLSTVAPPRRQNYPQYNKTQFSSLKKFKMKTLLHHQKNDRFLSLPHSKAILSTEKVFTNTLNPSFLYWNNYMVVSYRMSDEAHSNLLFFSNTSLNNGNTNIVLFFFLFLLVSLNLFVAIVAFFFFVLFPSFFLFFLSFFFFLCFTCSGK
jgi:hypothetical protein